MDPHFDLTSPPEGDVGHAHEHQERFQLTIVHGGQTGVERGAHIAAMNARLPVDGVMPLDVRDEFGPLPHDVAGQLRRHSERGYRPALYAAIELCTAAIILVPSIADSPNMPPARAVRRLLRAHDTPFVMCDPHVSVTDVAAWVRARARTSIKLLVTGPRQTRWAQGETIARRYVTAIVASFRDGLVGTAVVYE